MSHEKRISEELSVIRTLLPIVAAVIGSLVAWLLNRTVEWRTPFYTTGAVIGITWGTGLILVLFWRISALLRRLETLPREKAHDES